MRKYEEEKCKTYTSTWLNDQPDIGLSGDFITYCLIYIINGDIWGIGNKSYYGGKYFNF